MSLKCKFYGGATGSIFSKVWGKDIIVTEDDFNQLNINTYIPVWDDNTYILCEFKNILDGGSITSSIGLIENWLLYRQNQVDNSLIYINTLSSTTKEYYDFTTIDEHVYTYFLFVKGSLSISSPIQTREAIQSDYYGWYLIDTENNKSYQFDISFAGGDNNYIEDYTEHSMNDMTNIFTRGENNYLEISLTSIISKDNLKSDIKDTNDDLNSLSEFIYSHRPKILKSRRNNIYRVIVTEYKESLVNSALGENVIITNIKVKETGGV